MGPKCYHLILILVIYFINVESPSTANQSTADREGGIVCVIENIVSGIHETLLRLTKTSNNVSFPLTTVPDTHGLYHHIATSHPQEENETWRKFIVWEVVFQEAINELKVDEDDEMIQCVTLVNEQLFRGRPRQDSMVRVLKLVCADHGIPDRTISPKSKQNYFSSMNRYAFAHTYRMK